MHFTVCAKIEKKRIFANGESGGNQVICTILSVYCINFSVILYVYVYVLCGKIKKFTK